MPINDLFRKSKIKDIITFEERLREENRKKEIYKNDMVPAFRKIAKLQANIYDNADLDLSCLLPISNRRHLAFKVL